MDFQYVYLKKRSEFGRQCFFSSEPGALICDIAPNPELAARFVHVDPVERSTQVGVEMSGHEVCTDRAEFATTGVNHTEGGWGKDINPQDLEMTTRFKKKVEKEEGYITSVLQLGSMMEHCIKQNNTLDIYEEYFGGEEAEVSADTSIGTKTLNVFRDMCTPARSVTDLSWNPDATKLAAAYTSLKFQNTTRDIPVESFVWDIENPSRPEYTMSPPDSLVSVMFNPKEQFQVAGGTYRGRVCIFDRRRGSAPAEISALDSGHHDPVYSTIWVNSKSGTELFTGSTDGLVLWWDTRKMSAPVETLIMDINKKEEPQLKNACGASVLEYEPTIPTKFMIGTEQGLVIQCNRKGKTQAEKISVTYQAHLGPLRQLQRNPAFLKNFLTIGDWCAKIWSEECKESAIFWTQSGEVRLTGGGWSPSRPSVFFTTKANGTVDAWDVIYQQNAPVLTMQLGDVSLESMSIQESGRSLAVGSGDGQITLLQLSDGLVYSAKNDRQVLTAMFERETRREKILEGKNREARLKKSMKEGSVVKATSPLPPPGLTKSAQLERQKQEIELIAAAQNSYFETVYKEKQARREKQLAAMAAKGVDVELDSIDFQAPDVEGFTFASGADDVDAKPSTGSAKKRSSITVTKRSSSRLGAKASTTSKRSSTTAASRSYTVDPSSTEESGTADATIGDSYSQEVTETSAEVTEDVEQTETESMATAEQGETSSVEGMVHVASRIADVVDDLEQAVDELLDGTETEEATSPTEEPTSPTEEPTSPTEEATSPTEADDYYEEEE